MKLTDLKTSQEILANELRDPEFREEWERTALARAVALKVIHYRAEHGLSQRALGERLEMPQPQVSRLEAGDHNPSIDTLVRLSRALGLELTIDIRPADREPKLVNKRARTSDAVATYEADGYTVLLSAAA